MGEVGDTNKLDDQSTFQSHCCGRKPLELFHSRVDLVVEFKSHSKNWTNITVTVLPDIGVLFRVEVKICFKWNHFVG